MKTHDTSVCAKRDYKGKGAKDKVKARTQTLQSKMLQSMSGRLKMLQYIYIFLKFSAPPPQRGQSAKGELRAELGLISFSWHFLE